MIPPIEDSILKSNPKFSALHATLSNKILNSSGSTKSHPAQKERDAVTATLKSARLRAARLHLLHTAVRNIDLSPESTTAKPTTATSRTHSRTQSQLQPQMQKISQELPPDLVELIIILSARLSLPTIPASKLSLLESTTQWQSLPSCLPKISRLVSAYLHTQALHIARIISPNTNASFLHRTIHSLSSTINELQTEIKSGSAALMKCRMDLVPKITSLLSVYHLATTQIIQFLESVQYGSHSRHMKSQADFLHLSAEELSLEVKEKELRANRIVYDVETRAALRAYRDHLRDATERAGERGRDARRVLWGYGVGREGGEEKEKVMREIARVYGELRSNIKEVGRDVERLKRSYEAGSSKP